MENKIVGYMVVGFSVIIGLITWAFNNALSQIVETSCSHGPSCPMWGSITFHTNISIGMMVLVLLLGLYLIFFGDKKHSHQKEAKKKKTQIKKNNLTTDENEVIKVIEEAEGTIFQSEIVEKTEFTKVKITRILDKLEGRQIIERRRRGMSNVVILKN